MDLNLENITFVIVTFESENIIHQCINSLPKNSHKIVIENSKNINLKKDLESKYDNIEVIINENIGMGAANNIGIKKSKTQFAFVINPDVKFKEDAVKEIIESCKLIKDFAIISPINSDPNYPNYKRLNNSKNINENIINVDQVDGFSMLINKDKFRDQKFFGENFFLYLENNDLCLRVKNEGGSVYVVPSAIINHSGAQTVDSKYKNEVELSRNWHWLWSKFYFNKKHFGYIKAIRVNLLTYFSALFKFLFYLLINNKFKRKIYLNRASGFYNALIGKSSWYRPNFDD